MSVLRTIRDDIVADLSPISVLLILAGSILALDLYLPRGRAVVVLFVLVVILAGALSGPRFVLAAVMAGSLVTVGSYILRHGWVLFPAYAARRLFCVVAIVATGLLVIRNQGVQRRRRELATLLDLTGDAMFVRSIDGRITWWNHGAEQLYGWAKGQVLGRRADEVLGGGEGRHDRVAIAATTQTGAWEGELRHRSSDGRVVEVSSRWTLQTDAGGRPVSILETNTDITREKAAEAAMRASEDRHRQIFETGGAAICEADASAVLWLFEELRPDNAADLVRHLRDDPAFALDALDLVRVIDVNQTALAMFQATGKDQLRQSLGSFFPAGAVVLARGLLAAWAAGDTSFDAETTVQTVGGETRTVLMSVTFPRVQFTSLLVCMIDVTERRQAEAGLRAVQEELALAARIATLGELTSSIAQDIDRPIADIGRHARTGLDALRMPGADIRAVCDSIGRVVSEGRHAAEIITRVRDFLRSTAPAQAATDLNAIVEAAVALTRHEIADRQVTLQINLSPDLPLLDADGPRIEHVVVNLILNGIASMQSIPLGGGELVIETDLQGAELILRVKDNGGLCPFLGIDRLFEPVFTSRSDGTRRDIGLMVCRATVEAHRGRIWATPARPAGTIVHVALPMSGQ